METKSLTPPPTSVVSSTEEGLELEEEDSDDSTPVPEPGVTTSRVVQLTSCVQRCVHNVLQGFLSVFTLRFPIQQPPISFCRPQDHSLTGERDQNAAVDNVSPVNTEVLEVKVNFREELFDRYREVMEKRLEAKNMNSAQRVDELNLNAFPGWSRAVLLRLRSLFHIFDRGGDGLVDFTEFASTLDDYGDETPEEERRAQFLAADTDSIGSIDFEQFLSMMFNLTTKGVGDGRGHVAQPSEAPRVLFSKKVDQSTDSGHSNVSTESGGGTDEVTLTSLGTSLRQIDRNMSRIKSLDVVQQLQAGLF